MQRQSKIALIILIGAIAISLSTILILKSDTISTGNEVSKNIVLGQRTGTYGSFVELDGDTCETGGKPEVYMFSATWCPHCQWIEESFISWAEKRDDLSIYKYEIDTGDDVLTPEAESSIPAQHLNLFRQANPQQSVPTYIIGCKYTRIGNANEATNNLDAEIQEFDQLADLILN